MTSRQQRVAEAIAREGRRLSRLGRRKAAPPARRRPRRPTSRLSVGKVIGVLAASFISVAPYGALLILGGLAQLPEAPREVTDLAHTWLVVSFLPLCVLGGFIGIRGFAGPRWREWVADDILDARIMGVPTEAEYTTAYRIKKIVFLIAGLAMLLAVGALMLGFAWQTFGTARTTTLAVGLAALHLGFGFVGAGVYNVAQAKPLRGLILAPGGVVMLVAAGVLLLGRSEVQQLIR